MKTNNTDVRDISYDLTFFQSLKTGDKIYVKPGKSLRKKALNECVCSGPAYYNYDCSKPGWEIETSNGVIAYENSIFVSENTLKELYARVQDKETRKEKKSAER